MPAPSKPTPLTADQIDQLQAELDTGRLPAVWFTPAAVGVDAGRSAKVVAFTDPAEGDFIQVRPTGSADVLSFAPSELTMERPPRRRKGAEPPPPPPSRKGSAVKAGPPPAGPPPAGPASSPASGPARAEAAKPVTDELLVTRERPTRAPARPGRARQPIPVTVTLAATAEGEWTIDVLTGKKRAVRARAIAASAVAEAARAMGADVAEAIEGVLAAARDRQRDRVAELEAELTAARRALSQLAEG